VQVHRAVKVRLFKANLDKDRKYNTGMRATFKILHLRLQGMILYYTYIYHSPIFSTLVMILAKGTPAPHFDLNATPDQKLNLSDFKGKKLILAFYPADWSPVCSDQMSLYSATLKMFHKHNAEVLGISVDSKWCHMAFEQDRKIRFPLLADFNPKGKISKEFGVYNEQDGQAQRALFVIDESGIIQWSYLSPDGINPGADGILEALEAMDKSKK
jgi:peroxiredoxin